MDEIVAIPKVLAEVLRLQRWAGGDSVPADRIFGLLHGFESVIRQEAESFGISEELQEKVEDLLDDIENNKQLPKGPAVKARLLREKIDETAAARVIELCQLQSRFPDAIRALADAPGCIFPGLQRHRGPEQDWCGALHHMELVDCSSEERAKMYAVFAPTVPRIGETVRPQSGTLMEVVDVEHVVISQGEDEGAVQHYLVPHVMLRSTEDDDNG